jgi:hypothetical protein
MAIVITKETVHSPTARSISISSTDPVFLEIFEALKDFRNFVDSNLVADNPKVIHTRNNIVVTGILDGRTYHITVEVGGKPLTLNLEGRPAASYTYEPKSNGSSTKIKKTFKAKAKV